MATPLIPGCSGGNDVYYNNYDRNWFMFSAGSPNPFLFGGSSTVYDGREFCALAIPNSSWQLIKDVQTGKCLFADGDHFTYELTCRTNPYKASEEWNSGGSPTNALVLENGYILSFPSTCPNTLYWPAMSSDGVDNDDLIEECPLNNGGSQYASNQTWDVVRQSTPVHATLTAKETR